MTGARATICPTAVDNIITLSHTCTCVILHYCAEGIHHPVLFINELNWIQWQLDISIMCQCQPICSKLLFCHLLIKKKYDCKKYRKIWKIKPLSFFLHQVCMDGWLAGWLTDCLVGSLVCIACWRTSICHMTLVWYISIHAPLGQIMLHGHHISSIYGRWWSLTIAVYMTYC